MKRVIIESPYAGDLDANVAYARACLKDSLLRGEAPIASHLLYTQPGVLNDDKPDERALGIDAGHAWMSAADLVVVYHDMGVTEGMQAGIRRAFAEGRAVEFRKLDGCVMPVRSHIVTCSPADLPADDPRYDWAGFASQSKAAVMDSLALPTTIVDGPSEGFTTAWSCPLTGIPYADVDRLLNGWSEGVTATEAAQNG
ncbi:MULTISPECIES: hypothetical protein [unclassified Oceanicaulis]|uniref:DUF7768 domain-containing protein n=1 Tax=unclassified Oceanicaulis TaxID=2632123 RepID=UPI0025FD8802|nr:MULTISPECIES: hypothetical protein [unclassified Oceanicaulis]|tara:strand:+ start:309 stop:902 length:594 start_codon:yes stop_codon:yes gene_type:complete